jgi:hypothetical protein
MKTTELNGRELVLKASVIRPDYAPAAPLSRSEQLSASLMEDLRDDKN